MKKQFRIFRAGFAFNLFLAAASLFVGWRFWKNVHRERENTAHSNHPFTRWFKHHLTVPADDVGVDTDLETLELFAKYFVLQETGISHRCVYGSGKLIALHPNAVVLDMKEPQPSSLQTFAGLQKIHINYEILGSNQLHDSAQAEEIPPCNRWVEVRNAFKILLLFGIFISTGDTQPACAAALVEEPGHIQLRLGQTAPIPESRFLSATSENAKVAKIVRSPLTGRLKIEAVGIGNCTVHLVLNVSGQEVIRQVDVKDVRSDARRGKRQSVPSHFPCAACRMEVPGWDERVSP